jgi:hypothetical protein
MMRRLKTHLLTALALLVLSACQPSLPQPFQPDTIPTLTRPGVRAGLVVAPIKGAVDGAAFAEAVADALVAEDFAATTMPLPSPSYRLEGRAVESADSVRLEWQVEDMRSHLVGGTAYGLPSALLPGWRAGDPAFYRTLAKKAAAEIGNLLAESSLGTSERPLILIPEVSGAPGDGRRTLQRSMAYVLDKRGLKVTEDAASDEKPTMILRGSMKVATKDARSHVEITWTLSRIDGASLGTVAQANDVPAGLLEGPWGDVAFSIADAAADGITNLVESVTVPTPKAQP